MPITGVAAAGVDPAAALVDALNTATAATTAATTATTAATAATTAATAALTTATASSLQKSSNLSDLASVATARTNLGVPASTRLVSAGIGLTGGGDLSADRTFAVDFVSSGASSSTKSVRADDSRLSDTRTPSASSVTTSTLASSLVIDGGVP